MGTRGMLGALGVEQAGGGARVEYEDVIRECERIRDEHDRRVDRAMRAVGMLREKYEWKARVEVEVEEPEDADFGEDSFIGRANAMDMEDINGSAQEGQGNGNVSEGSSSDGDEEELENVLGTGAEATPEPDEDVPMQG
ncbi:hypothetical protein EWM64_g3786 [Hericium alpestre]|uniref:Uncharacterized protein n=1 Tax=Hericium alpestre TaxID=135208 RepID=A0A4Z0A1L9_9AGAM|nr:hypothetical protein EWM64_g3786 [Hericium alpestre]